MDDMGRRARRAALAADGVPLLDDTGRVDARYLPRPDAPGLAADAVGVSVCPLGPDRLVPVEYLPSLAPDVPDLSGAVDDHDRRLTDLTDRVADLTAQVATLQLAVQSLAAPTTPIEETA